MRRNVVWLVGILALVGVLGLLGGQPKPPAPVPALTPGHGEGELHYSKCCEDGWTYDFELRGLRYQARLYRPKGEFREGTLAQTYVTKFFEGLQNHRPTALPPLHYSHDLVVRWGGHTQHWVWERGQNRDLEDYLSGTVVGWEEQTLRRRLAQSKLY